MTLQQLDKVVGDELSSLKSAIEIKKQLHTSNAQNRKKIDNMENKELKVLENKNNNLRSNLE